MELSNFIAITIQEIVSGALEARQLVEPMGAQVVPFTQIGKDAHSSVIGTSELTKLVYAVEFDVALTISEQAGTAAKMGVLFPVFGLGGEANEQSTNSHFTRAKFTIPVVFPTSGLPRR